MNIFYNADFISCEPQNAVHRVLIEEAGRIVYMGDRIPDQYSRWPRHDLGNKCVVPAFVDSHIHFSSFALFHSTLDCRHVRSFEELTALTKGYINQNPSEKVILGFGCSAHTVREKRLPQLSDLDKITSLPLMLIKYDGHAAIANTAMIKSLPKKVYQHKGFFPTSGWFFQEAFYAAVNALTRKISLFRILKNMLRGADYLARKGIGLVHTVEGVGFPMDMDVNLMRFAARGLPQAYRTYFQTMDVKKVLKRNLPAIGGCFETALDGCFGSQDAALRAPYQNNRDNTGVLSYNQAQVNAFVSKAHEAGLQVAMHAIGDAAIEQALNAFERIMLNDPHSNRRHVLIHADLMTPDLIEKAAALRIAIALQTPFLMWPQEPVEYLQSLLGDRMLHLIPLKSMLEAGLLLANGSDAPCTLPDPILGIHAACNHPIPAQRIAVEDALKMHTCWAAQLSFDEIQRGTLSRGKRADFVVLDYNPLKIPVNKISRINIDDVYYQGQKYTGLQDSTYQFIKNCVFKKA